MRAKRPLARSSVNGSPTLTSEPSIFFATFSDGAAFMNLPYAR